MRRQVRLGLVLNGGVSLAVWIGGVTKELDNLRRAAKTEPAPEDSTLRHYRELLQLLEEEVVVDVIAGASAGGINGVLLATSIYTGQPLPNLRETWIGIGDFGALLRSPREPNPASLMKGDAVILAELQRLIDHLYMCGAAESAPRLDHPLYLYITATDLFGHISSYRDTTGRRFEESDARRRLTFQCEGPRRRSFPKDLQSVMRPIVDFGDEDAPQLLGLAARSSSSFPVAFEARELSFVERSPAAVGEPEPAEGQPVPKRHWMIDGGILDNQPFNPVLDRISFLSAEVPVKRIVTYVVPYVNEPGTLERPAREFATAMETQAAAGRLPRDLPKLESLERVTAEHDAQEVAEEDRRRLWREVETNPQNPQSLQNAANALFEIYQKTRYAASVGVWKAWAAPDFRPGSGVLAQDPTIDPREITSRYGAAADPEPTAAEVQQALWVADSADWAADNPVWDWGLAPAERVAAYALLFLRDAAASDAAVAADPALADARVTASQLAEGVRRAKTELQTEFRNTQGSLLERAHAAYANATSPEALQLLFRDLNAKLQVVRSHGVSVPLVRDLLHLEVVQNAVSIVDPRTPSPFDFLFASAGIPNSLGHAAASPQTKLAGMRLSHFAGFLKRSWRANDWLWGRLDGVEHALRALLDLNYIARLSLDKPTLLSDLADLAFPADPEERDVVTQAWNERLGRQAQWEQRAEIAAADRVGALTANLPAARDQFIAVLEQAIAQRDARPRLAQQWLDCCRCALAARIQLAILSDDLERVAVTAAEDVEHGASKSASSVYWSSDFFRRDDSLATTTPLPLTLKQRVELFKRMRIGEETLAAESDSRHTIGISAQILGVASAMFAGDRGGLPLPIRSSLATIRGLTLPLSSLARISAAEPWFGAAITTVVTGLVLWLALSKNALLGAFFPALALLVVVMWLVLFTIATSLFEESLRSWQRILGFAVLTGLPLVFGLLAGYPGLERLRNWIDGHLGAGLTRTAAVIALLAAAVALLRLAVAVKPASESGLPGRYLRLGVLGLLLVLLSVLAWWPDWTRDHLSTWIGGDTRRILGVIAAALGLTFLARSAVRWTIRLAPTWRRKILKWYRPIVFAALLTLAGGFIARRWVDQTEKKHGAWVTVADEHKGTILVVILLGTLFAAAVIIENFLPTRKRSRRDTSNGSQGSNTAAAGSALPPGVTYTLAALLALNLGGWAFYAGLISA